MRINREYVRIVIRKKEREKENNTINTMKTIKNRDFVCRKKKMVLSRWTLLCVIQILRWNYCEINLCVFIQTIVKSQVQFRSLTVNITEDMRGKPAKFIPIYLFILSVQCTCACLFNTKFNYGSGSHFSFNNNAFWHTNIFIMAVLRAPGHLIEL